jgi:Alpha/beta hydrolase of unknown function (DUF900)
MQWVTDMDILRIDVAGGEIDPDDLHRVARATSALGPDRPVTFLVHGFRYDPACPGVDPHRFIYSADTAGSGRYLSWVRHLGFRAGNTDAGLCIALGWPARGTLRGAHQRAGQTGRALAVLIRSVHQARPGTRVGAIGHSLGARVILSALPYLPPHHLSRAVLLSPAAFRDDTTDAVDSPAGRTAEIISVTSRENDVFDLCMELLASGGTRASVGHVLGQTFRNWTDVRLDDAPTLTALASLGFPVSPRSRRVCHWSAYRRAGVFALYRALLTDPARLAFTTLAAALPPAGPVRRSAPPSWPVLTFPLPFRRGTPS